MDFSNNLVYRRQETQVWSLGREDPLEEEMATRSSILAWRIPWAEEAGGLQSMGSKKSWMQLNCNIEHSRVSVTVRRLDN